MYYMHYPNYPDGYQRIPQNQTQQKPAQVECMPITLSKSIQGKYFLGQAKGLVFDKEKNAWAGLMNPRQSGVNLFVHAFDVTNKSKNPFQAEIWLNANPPGKGSISNLVGPSNTAISPLPQPRVQIQYASSISGVPTGGLNLFGRRIEPEDTLVAQQDGKYIIPPGGSFLVFLTEPEAELLVNAVVIFGWWEEPLGQY